MASRLNRGLLSSTTSSKQSRKYLGDPHDPHYIPKTPLIDRQYVSPQDEAELRRMCTIALSGVPHSDEMTDDPFRYLASHITVKSQILPQTVEEKSQEPLTSPQTWEADDNYTATPSETSKRETLQTNVTTPMTTPGVTPGEIGKRFSDALRPAAMYPNSNLRTETNTVDEHAVHISSGGPVPLVSSQVAAATMSLTHLPAFAPIRTRQPLQENTIKLLSNPEINKSLPTLPSVSPSISPPTNTSSNDKPRGLSRILKTVLLQRTQSSPVIEVKSTPINVPEQIQQTNKNANLNVKKRRFNITAIFEKRNTIHPKRATVG